MSQNPIHRIQLGPIRCSSHTIRQVLDEIGVLLRDRTIQPRSILDLNAHSYNLATKDDRLRRVLNTARVVTADGMGVVWAARLFGARIPERCNSTEAFRAFLSDPSMPPSTARLVGCTEEEGRAAAAAINGMNGRCRITATVSGFLDETAYREIFRNAREDFLLLGLSTPRTQYVAEIAAEVCPGAIMWGIGAGTIRIFAGTMKEAPVFWRRTGLQWLYRLFEDPKNLWRRYLVGNPLFIARILKARWGRGISS